MGINRRHEYLATGETVTMAGRLACLAVPNTVVSRQVPARPAQGACALEDVGSQARTGVADPRGVCRVLSPTVVAGVPFLVGRDKEMGLLMRRWEECKEGLGQVVLGMRQEP